MQSRIRLLGLLLAAALAWPGGAAAATDSQEPDRPAAEESSSAADRIGPALEERVMGRAGLGDVRVDAFWSSGGKATAARVFGDGVGVWQGEAQFRLSKSRIFQILELIRKAKFGSMPDRFGEDEEEEAEGNKGPELRGRLVVRAGAQRKITVQLVKGDQSKEFARLVQKILAICEKPGREGLRAASMSEALGMLASGKLSPEVLEAAVQRRPDAKAAGGAEAGWTLRLAGLQVSEQRGRPDEPPEAARTLALPEKEFRDLAALLAKAEPATLPQSLYAESYTDFSIEILAFSRTIVGRRFLGMTPETHGGRQKAFDRILAAFDALHRRVEAR